MFKNTNDSSIIFEHVGTIELACVLLVEYQTLYRFLWGSKQRKIFEIVRCSCLDDEALNDLLSTRPVVEDREVFSHSHDVAQYFLALDYHWDVDQGALWFTVGGSGGLQLGPDLLFLRRLKIGVVLSLKQLFSLVDVQNIKRHEVLDARQ